MSHRASPSDPAATMAAGARLGARHLRVLVGPEPQHGTGHLGSRAAQARARGRVRASRRSAAAVARPAVARLAVASAYAATDELHQTFVAGRVASSVDWAIDTAAVVIGVAPTRRTSGAGDAGRRDRPRRRARRHSQALARVPRRCCSTLPDDRAARRRLPPGRSRPGSGGRSTDGRRTESATGARRWHASPRTMRRCTCARTRRPARACEPSRGRLPTRRLHGRSRRSSPGSRLAARRDRRLEALETGDGSLDRLVERSGARTLRGEDASASSGCSRDDDPYAVDPAREAWLRSGGDWPRKLLDDRELDAILERLDRPDR